MLCLLSKGSVNAVKGEWFMTLETKWLSYQPMMMNIVSYNGDGILDDDDNLYAMN